MKSYLQIVFKYFQNNRRRTVITMVGIIISAIFMFALVDALVCMLHHERKVMREIMGYEAIFLNATEGQAEQMKRDYNIADYVFHSYTEYPSPTSDPVVYEKALYVKFAHPFFMRKDYEKICNDMGLEGVLNEELATSYHFQADGSLMSVFFALGLLACFLVGSIAVLVTKNTLKLSVLEKIRDYGALRCIGSSMRQLKHIVVLEAVTMAIPATVIGSFVGYLVMNTVLEELSVSMETFFSPVALLVTTVSLLFAMYFSSIEPCQMLGKITPVMAMNQQLTPLKKERKRSAKKQERLQKKEEKKQQKQREKAEKNWKNGKSGFHLYGKLFGIEGEYAYKSMKRNRRKYYGTMFAFMLSVVLFLVMLSISGSLQDYIQNQIGQFGRYNAFILESPVYFMDSEQTAYGKVDANKLEGLSKMAACKDIKNLYVAQMDLAENTKMSELYTKELLLHSSKGRWIAGLFDRMEKKDAHSVDLTSMGMAQTEAYGFGVTAIEEEEFSNYKEAVVEGTADYNELGEDGILLINQNYYYDEEDDYNLGIGQNRKLTITNYKVGDTITFLDLQALRKEFQKQYKKQGEEDYKNKLEAYVKARAVVQKQGKVKKYVIKGMLDGDVIGTGFSEVPIVVCKKEQFFAMTGLSAEQKQGYRISVDLEAGSMAVMNVVERMKTFSKYEWNEDIYEEERIEGPEISCDEIENQAIEQKGVDQMQVVLGCIALILFSISTINIINNNASSIYLRRTELAQMRVIGMTKKGLVKTLALEGIIVAGVATILGTVIGLLISYGIVKLMKFVFMELEFCFPLLGVVLVFFVTVLIMLISTAIPVAALNKDIVADLAVEE